MPGPDRRQSDPVLEECPYRQPASGAGVLAQCRLLTHILATDDPEVTSVSPEACKVCCRSDYPTPQQYNSVIASFVHGGSCRIIDRHGLPASDLERALRLREFAVSELVRTTLSTPGQGHPPNGQSVLRRRLVSCDVIVCCTDESDATAAAVESALSQEGVRCTVHVVDDGGGVAAILRRFQGREGVSVYRNPERIGVCSTLVQLLPVLKARYVAFQDPHSLSRPDRLKRTIDLLERQGSEIAATAVETPRGRIFPQAPACASDGVLPWQSLVMRRTTLLDMQRIQPSGMSDQVSLIRQASCEHRSFALDRLVTVDVPEDSGGIVASAAPSDPPGRITAPDRTRPAVDVVLPFRDTIDFVNESLPSVLEQAGVDVVVHLVDDASTTDTSRHLDDWARDPRIRIYRNLRNLGPYVSFNNVSRFFETDFVAIQDADDISLPHRLRVAVASLQTGRADIFGAAVEMFGDDRERPITTKVVSQGVAARLVPRRRYSRYPASDRIFAVLNGSAVMRTQEFVRLGGFADYGDPEHNRCGLDSEFYARAHFAGCHFFISREIVLRNRRHAQSATQNSETGWGTARRMLAREKLLERIAVWQRYEFDPRDFGGLDRYADLTERIM